MKGMKELRTPEEEQQINTSLSHVVRILGNRTPQ